MSRNYKLFSILTLLIFISWNTIQAQDLLVRRPALSPDGQTIAFSWQGDIFTVAATGGDAKRLTIHESYEGTPVWSKDGQTIAFTSARNGNSDIYTISKNGGNLKRLTHHSTSDYNMSMDDKGNIYFSTRRAFATVDRENEIYVLKAGEQTPTRALDAVAQKAAISPNGRFVALERGYCRIAREAYRGSANRDIWMYDNQTKQYFSITTDEGQDVSPVWAGNSKLFYLSAKSGRYNLYSTSIDGNGKATGETTQITKFKKDGIRHFSLSANGETVVFTQGGSIYSQATSGGKAKKINITVGEDYRFDPVEHKTLRTGVNGFDVSPNGKYIVYEINGEIFVAEADKEKTRTVNVSNHSYRDREAIWLNDTTIIFSSDRAGNYDLYLARSSDKNQTNIFKSFKHEVVRITNTPTDERWVEIAPNGKKLVFDRGVGDLVMMQIDTNGTLVKEKTIVKGWSNIRNTTWSPDSRYLAYSKSDLNFNSEVYIHTVDGSREPVNVSMHPRGDYSPVWSRDGSKLGFTSIRNNGDADVWFAWLKKSDWEKTQADWDFDEDEEPKSKKGKKGDKKKGNVKPMQIDFDGLHERLTQVTYMPGDENNVEISADGETFYFSSNRGGATGSDFNSVKWNGKEMKTVLPKQRIYGVSLSKDGKHLFYFKSGKVNKLPVKGKKPETFGFTAKMDVDHLAVRTQVFDEAWRVLKDGFYDPNFHGQNWDALRSKYRPIALAASTKQDFQTIYNEMLGQLNASHMGLYVRDLPEKTQDERTGLLGIEVEQASNGVKVKTVIPNTPADKSQSKLNVGDVITSINGKSTTGNNFSSLLIGTRKERTLLEVTSTSGEKREVIIRPTSSIRTDLYKAWVAERKALTEKYSNGKLGYIHIQGMNWTSFERFERELMAAGVGKEGIVIDVRYNGGGWTTDMMMAVLNVQQHSYTVPRGATDNLKKDNQKFREYYPYGERLPLSAWTKPAISLCNEFSYSNAEIFSHAFKTLDRGTLVGKTTFGAVISTGGTGLMDGSFVRRPFRAWYVKATGENMEKVGAVPDIELENSINYRANMTDEQLQKAVETLLSEMK